MQVQGKARRAAVAAIGALALCGATAAGAQAASSVAVTAPGDVIRYSPVTVTVTGTAETPVELHAVMHSACSPYPPSEPGELLEPGPFTRTRTFAFDHWADRICVWLSAPNSPSTVHASGSAIVRPRRAAATLSVAVPGQLTLNVPTTVTVSGTVDTARVVELRPVDYGGSCPTWPAEWDDNDPAPLTEAGGTSVGPGPFSLAVPWTPVLLKAPFISFNRPLYLCAHLFPARNRTVPEAAVSLKLDVQLPPAPEEPPRVIAPPQPLGTVALVSPADGAAGELLNPRFAWTASDRPRRDPVARDVVELVRVEGEKRIPLLRIGTKSYRSLSSLSWRYLRIEGTGDTSEIAVVDGSSFKFAYGGGYMPGTYEWRVLRDGWESPPTRSFVVRAKPLSSFRLKVSPERGDSSSQPVFAQIELTSVPFLFIRLHRRISGSPWRLSEWRSWSAYQRDVLDGTCRRPGGRVHWRLHVRDAFGTERTRSGSFANASRSLCAQLMRREADERRRDSERRRADARRRAEAERRRREAEHRRIQAEIDRYKRNCRAIGGTPVLIEGYWYCRADAGGTLHVPGF